MRDQVMVTFPKMGRSTDPHVSAPQWTSPDAKSAVSIPAAENERVRKVRTTNTEHKTEEHCIIFLTNAQQDVPQMSQVEIGKKVNEIEGHDREAEDDTYPFLTSFALKEKHHD